MVRIILNFGLFRCPVIRPEFLRTLYSGFLEENMARAVYDFQSLNKKTAIGKTEGKGKS